ncbi:MAG: hypothetical protein QXU72_07665 [Thermofilum sp.]
MRTLLPFLLSLMVAAATSPLAQPYPRHVNPDEVTPSVDVLKLTQIYAELASMLRSENFTGYLQLGRYLLELQAPGDVAFIISRFHELSLQQGLLLNSTREALREAESHLRFGDFEGALELLGEALRTLTRVNATYVSLADAAEAVQRRVKAAPGPLLEAVRLLASSYYLRAAELNESLHTSLIRTRLTLKSTTGSAWVGSTALFYGTLETEGGDPLPQREVTLLCDGRVCGRALTDSSGTYYATVSVPYVYVSSMVLVALYEPSGPDARVYRPSVSEPFTLNLTFFTPRVNVTVTPSVVTPGSRVRVEAESSLRDASFVLYGLGQQLLAGTSEGRALWEVEVPGEAREGAHAIKVCTVPRGVYGPGCGSAELVVKKLALYVNLEVPSILLAMVPFTVKVSVLGEGGGLPDAFDVHVAIPEGGLAVEKSYPAPQTPIALEATLPPLVPGGKAKLTVTVTSHDPAYSSGSAEAEILIVNPLLIAVSALLAGSAFAAYTRASKRLRRAERAEVPAEVQAGTLETSAPEVPAPELAEEPSRPLKAAAADPVVSEYLQAVAFVEKVTGVQMEPSHTISEYLSLVSFRLGPKAAYFEKLSRVVEARLYADEEVDLSYVKSLRRALESAEGEAS